MTDTIIRKSLPPLPPLPSPPSDAPHPPPPPKHQFILDFLWKVFNYFLSFIVRIKEPATKIRDSIKVRASIRESVKGGAVESDEVIAKQKNIANELLETEKKYVQNLQILHMLFLLPIKDTIKAGKPLISDAELRSIFSYIEAILNLHTAFCKELGEVISKGDIGGIGEVFLKNWEFFKMYSSYINGYNVSLETLAQCKRDYPLFEKFIEATERNPMCAKLDLAAYLIMPVQRLPRYILLLNDLLKNMSKHNPAHDHLEQSIEKLKSVTMQLNESKRIAENTFKVFEIQQSLSEKNQAIMEPHRTFHSEGNCVVRNLSSKMKNMHYFLFNDMILLVSPGTSLFNRDVWKVQYQLLLQDLAFSVLEHEKGLLITGKDFKLILILDDLPQTQELTDTLNSLKDKVPNTSTAQKLPRSKSMHTILQRIFTLRPSKMPPLQGAAANNPKVRWNWKLILPIIFGLLAIGGMVLYKYLYIDATASTSKSVYGPGLRFRIG